jgi:uncharacterized protein (TIGR02597 family)
MNPFRLLLLAILAVLVTLASSSEAATLNVPARATNALSGQQFVNVILPMATPPDTQRENWIYAQIASGNVPNFMRTLIPITTNATVNSVNHTVTYYVTPDYMAIGSDSDYFLEPMTPLLAQRLDTLLGTIRPTRKMVDQIANRALVHLQPNPIPPDPNMITVPYFNQHNTMVWTQRVVTLGSFPLGSLVDGDKKDVIISPKIYTNFAQSSITKPVVIYGWHYPDGTFIQPEYNGHEETYADYSHGIRMVQNAIILDGTNTTISAVLTNPAIAAVLSDETTFTGNVIPKPFYTVAAVAPVIITQPYSRAVGPGTNVQFSVMCAGDPSLNYTWKLNGSAISGATDSVLTINNAQSSNIGTYSVVVANTTGSATSWNASLTVTPQTHPILFADDFDSNSSANWNVFWGADNNNPDYTITWAYDYGATPYTYGGLYHVIPPSPHSSGSTKGVKFTVNTTNGANVGVNIYPKNKTFSGNFSLKFDMWINYPGGANGTGATGSTQFGIYGINHTGTRANWGAATASATDGLWFGNDGDGGTTRDDRAYLGNLAGIQTELIGATSGLSASNHAAAIYQSLFPAPPNESAGAPGKTWVSVEVDQTNNNITVLMNGAVIAQRTNTSVFTNGTIMLGLMDVFPSLASPVVDSYVIFDNVSVEDLSATGVAPNIVSQPQPQNVPVNSPATFSVSATGTSLSYQWQFDGNNIANATDSSYTIASAQSTNIGYYSVIVSNSLGTATSTSANLTISGYYFDNLDANSAANWVTNTSSADNRLTWNFDYSTVGIPQLSGAANTRALKMEANLSLAAVAAINLSPKNQNFTGDYQLRFNVWLNFVGPAPGGGTGSTESFTAGIGTTGDRVEWAQAGNTANGVWVASTGDGGSSPVTPTYPDYAVYTNFTGGAASTLVRSNSGIYAAPNNANPATYHGNTYYTAAFPGKTIPASQTALAPSTQTGTANSGSQAFAWHEVILKKVSNVVTWSIDGVKIASVTNAIISGNNVSIGYMDPFASVAATNFQFGLFNNFRVEPPDAQNGTAPLITAQPQSTSVSPNATATFSVSATSATTLRYQWQKNGFNMANATNSTLTLVNVQSGDAGTYHVLVLNDFSFVTSADATLTVLQGPTKLQSAALNPDNSVNANWTTDGSSTYTLQYKSNLTDATWTTVANYISSGATLTVADVPRTDAQRFYRLVSAQHASDIAGIMSFNLLGNSDNIVSLPLLRGPSILANVDSVSGNVVTVMASAWNNGQFVYTAPTQTNTYYARFISGALAGRIYTITGNTANSLTLNLGSDFLSALAQYDQLSVEPYWTLATTFPNGAGVNVSPTQGNRNTEILIPDQSTPGVNLSAAKVYFFNNGNWKQVGQGAVNHNDDILAPNAHFIVRHNVATNTVLALAGLVLSDPISIALQSSATSQQDNFIGLTWPAQLTLNNSQLLSSGAFAASPLPGTRADELLTFDNSIAQKNKSSSSIYYYWSNAWRRVGSGTLDVGDTPAFLPGTGVVIRKATNSLPANWQAIPNW